MSDVKFCKDCKHSHRGHDNFIFFKIRRSEEFIKCNHPLIVSKVDGKPETYCYVERNVGFKCGSIGRLWEQK